MTIQEIIFQIYAHALQVGNQILTFDRSEELEEEIEAGVRFYGWFEDDILIGVMGMQPFKDTTLVRHSYILTEHQRRGIGGRLLKHLKGLAETSEILVGTWEDASWAIRFYEKHGFKLVSNEEKDRLLRKYWRIPEGQIETSVVLRLTDRGAPAASF